ncbi:MAG: mechanosensitive ion channel domain-containing protein [Pyrinomonadaceae bacterium]
MDIWTNATAMSGLNRQLLMNVALWQQQPDQQNVAERIWSYINYKFTIGNISVSLSSLVLGVLIFVVAMIVSRALQSYLQRRMEQRGNIDRGIQYTIFRLAHYLIITLGVLFALRLAFQLDLTSLAVLFTALSVGIGFGLQFIAGDIASGFILLFERPVRVGDFVTIASDGKPDTEGRVQSINLRTTVVMTNDRIAVVVPNSKLVNQTLVNWSSHDRRARVSIPVGVSYDADVEVVTRTLLRAAEGVKYVIEDPVPSVQFLRFGDSSLDFRLLVWTANPRRHPQIKSDINYRIRKLFLEEGIEIPFPHRDIYVRGGALEIKRDGDGLGLEDIEAAEEDRLVGSRR